MDIRLTHLKLSAFLALALLGMAPFVSAQPAATNAWKPIIFSSPAENEISSNPISPSTQPMLSMGPQGLLQGPTPIASFRGFRPAPAPNARGQIHKSAQDSEDWIFMTPAEIMGVSSDQILQKGKHKANGQREYLTPM